MIRAEDEWRYVPGLVYGLQQPCVMGEVWVQPVGAEAAASVAARLRELVEEEPPALDPTAPAAQSVAALVAFLSGALQRRSRVPVSERFHLRRLEPAAGDAQLHFELALPTALKRVAPLALKWSVELVKRAAQDPWNAALAQSLRERAHDALAAFADRGINRVLIVRAAHRLDIPVRACTDKLLLLGTGVHARYMDSTATDRTSAIGVGTAKNKHRTAWLLREAGLPGALNVLVDSAQAALRAARQLGYPVVVKPNDLDRGVAVAADLRDDAAVEAAYRDAVSHSSAVLVEKWHPGMTHRINVCNGEVIRVSRRKPGGVMGDGVHDIAALVEQRRQDPEHRATMALFRKPLVSLDAEALGLLQQDGRAPGDVPPAGEFVRLRRRDNVNAGAIREELDHTDPGVVHPDNLRLAVDATRALALDLSGIDLLIEDVSRSWLETGALICEINAKPQLPLAEIHERILASMFAGGTGRIPAWLLVVPDEPQRRQAALDRAVASGRFTGVADRSGLRLRGTRVSAAFAGGLAAGRALLMRTDVDRAACLMTPAEIAAAGTPLDRWDALEYEDLAAFTAEETRQLETVRRWLAPAIEPHPVEIRLT